MKTSKIFKLVQTEIKNGENYVCISLSKLRRECKISYEDQERLQIEISHRLQGCYTVMEWLDVHHPEWADMNTGDSVRNRTYRLAWLDQLIAEFKAKGD